MGRSRDKPTGAINFGDNLWPANRFVYETYKFPQGQDASTDFHIYSVIWEPDVIRWYVDDVLYSTKTPRDLLPDSWRLNDTEFFIIMNNAVGGMLGGNIEKSDIFPAQMIIDYVKVSQLEK